MPPHPTYSYKPQGPVDTEFNHRQAIIQLVNVIIIKDEYDE